MPDPTLTDGMRDALTALVSRPLTPHRTSILDRDLVSSRIAGRLVDQDLARLADGKVHITPAGAVALDTDGRATLDRIGPPDTGPGAAASLIGSTAAGAVIDIPVDQLHPAEDNVRRDVGDIDGLAASITAVGILEPLLVAPLDGGGWRIVAGHRRHAAAGKAGLATVPCLVRDFDDAGRVEAMIVENLQREGLTPMEEADAYQRLVGLGWPQSRIAERIGVDQATVSRRLSLRKLPDRARDMLGDGTLHLDQAYQLAKLPTDRVALAIDGKMTHADPPRNDQIGWAIRHHTDQVRAEKARAKARRGLESAGVPIIQPDVQHVTRWTHVPGFSRLADALPHIDLHHHQQQPCHAAFITTDGEIVHGCTDPDPHRTTANAAAPREPNEWEVRRQARQARQTSWDTAAEPRMAWLRDLAARTTVEADATTFALAIAGGLPEECHDDWSRSRALGIDIEDLDGIRQRSRAGTTGPGWAAWWMAIGTCESLCHDIATHPDQHREELYRWATSLYLDELARLADTAAGLDLPGGHDHHQALSDLLTTNDEEEQTDAA